MDFSISDDEMKEAFLDRPLQPISQTITIDSNHVHYVYLATGKPNLAVFVHGSPGSWSAFVDYLKNDTLMEKYDVVSIDRPGFGQSDGGRPERSIGRQAFQMQEVISRFSHENKVLIGHSLGGPVV
ncbi:MAG: alpha/beta hydrolase, partial [Marinoscillum sp.]